MKFRLVIILLLGAGLFGPRLFAAGHELNRVTIGFLPDSPLPSQFSQAQKTFESALGLRVDWLPFASGADLRQALLAGRVQIALPLDLVEFIFAVSSGADLTLVGIAASYPESDNCIVSRAAAISRDNAEALAGQKVALEPGGLTHYRMLAVLDHLQVDTAAVEILAVDSGETAAAALGAGEVAMACAAGEALDAMSALGQPLLSGGEQAGIGLGVFAGIAVATGFIREHADLVQAFMDVVEATNEQWRLDAEPMRAAIARAAGIAPETAERALARSRFPNVAAQKSDAWLGARLPAYGKEIADFLVGQGRLDAALDDYAPYVTTRFLR